MRLPLIIGLMTLAAAPARGEEFAGDPSVPRERQREVKRRAERLAGRVRTLVRVLEYYRYDEKAERKLLAEAAGSLEGLSRREMTAVMAHLERAAKDSGATGKAYEAHRKVVRRLGEMLTRFEAINSLEEAAGRLLKRAGLAHRLRTEASDTHRPRRNRRSPVDRFREIGDRQADLNRDLEGDDAALRRLQPGLTPEQAARLKASAALKKLPEVADWLDDAARRLRRHDSGGAKRLQAKAIDELKAVALALRRPADPLQDLKAARDRVAKALEKQEKALAATKERLRRGDFGERTPPNTHDPRKYYYNRVADDQADANDLAGDAEALVKKQVPDVAEELKKARERMKYAEDDLRRTNTHHADGHQEDAAERLRVAKGRLDWRIAEEEKRRVDPLAAARKATQDVEDLIERQEDLRKDTKDTKDDPKETDRNAEDQADLARDTEDVKAQPKPGDADKELAKAAAAMKKAADELKQGDPEKADAEQKKAIDALKKARDKLAAKADEVAKRRAEMAELEAAEKALGRLADDQQKLADRAKQGDNEALAGEQQKNQGEAEKAAGRLQKPAPKAADAANQAAEQMKKAAQQMQQKQGQKAAESAQKAADQTKKAQQEAGKALTDLKAKEAADQAAMKPNEVKNAAAAAQVAKALAKANEAKAAAGQAAKAKAEAGQNAEAAKAAAAKKAAQAKQQSRQATGQAMAALAQAAAQAPEAVQGDLDEARQQLQQAGKQLDGDSPTDAAQSQARAAGKLANALETLMEAAARQPGDGQALAKSDQGDQPGRPGQQPGQKPGQGTQPGQKPSQERNDSKGVGEREADGRASNAKSELKRNDGKGGFINLPPRQRAKIRQALGAKVPAEYGALIDEYYKNIASGKPAGKDRR